MRITTAAIAAMLVATAPAASRAESVTITFDALASRDGQTLVSYNPGDGFTLYSDFFVVGPSTLGYDGHVGIIPAFDQPFEIIPEAYLPLGITLQDFSVTYADYGGPSVVQEWQIDNVIGQQTAIGMFKGTDGTFTAAIDQPYVGRVVLIPALGDESQILSITLDFTLPTASSVPEPGTGVLMAIGAIGLVAVRRRGRQD